MTSRSVMPICTTQFELLAYFVMQPSPAKAEGSPGRLDHSPHPDVSMPRSRSTRISSGRTRSNHASSLIL